VTSLFDGVGKGAYDFLVIWEARELLQILGEGLGGNGLDGSINEVVLKEVLE